MNVNQMSFHKKKKNNAQQQNVKNVATETIIIWLRLASNFLASTSFVSFKNCSVFFTSLTAVPPPIYSSTIVHGSCQFAKRPQQNKYKNLSYCGPYIF